MLTLEYDYDPGVWLPVPTDLGSAKAVDRWASGAAVEARSRSDAGAGETSRGVLCFAGVAEAAAQYGRTHDDVWLAVTKDAPGIVLVLVDVLKAEGSLDDRLASYAATAGIEYEPPQVVQVDTGGLGTGAYVLRQDIADDRKIFVTVNFAFRVHGYDIVVAAQSYNTAAMAWAVPQMITFVERIRVTEPTETR